MLELFLHVSHLAPGPLARAYRLFLCRLQVESGESAERQQAHGQSDQKDQHPEQPAKYPANAVSRHVAGTNDPVLAPDQNLTVFVLTNVPASQVDGDRAQVGLTADVGALHPAELSGGMQKRVALARAIAADPEIIFFDEPTTGLDPIMADVINNLIVDCVKRLGATTISITHDMASARKIADDIAMIYKGQIIWRGEANKVNASGNEYVDQFIHGRAEGPIQMDVLKL